MPNLTENNTFIESIFGGEVFKVDGEIISWDKAQKELLADGSPSNLDHYTLRLDTFDTFDPSLSDLSLSGRKYNEFNYIASVDGAPKVVSIGEGGLGQIDIRTFPFSLQGEEFTARSLTNESSALDMRLVAEWWHWEWMKGKKGGGKKGKGPKTRLRKGFQGYG